MNPQRGVDPVGPQFGRAVHDSHVGLVHLALLELLGDAPLGAFVFGDDHDAGGVAVEPVHDARAKLAQPAGQPVRVVDQGVDQGPANIAPAGVHDQIGLLVQDDHVVVLVEDVQRDILRLDVLARRLRDHQLDHVAVGQAKAGLDGFAVDLYAAGADGVLQKVPAEIAESAVEILIEPSLRNADAHVERQRPTSEFLQFIHLCQLVRGEHRQSLRP